MFEMLFFAVSWRHFMMFERVMYCCDSCCILLCSIRNSMFDCFWAFRKSHWSPPPAVPPPEPVGLVPVVPVVGVPPVPELVGVGAVMYEAPPRRAFVRM